jgi:hypothetical protein
MAVDPLEVEHVEVLSDAAGLDSLAKDRCRPFMILN